MIRSKIGGSEVISQCTGRQKTLDNQQSNQNNGWWPFLWNLGTMVNIQEFICLETSFEVKVSKKLGFGIHQKCTVKSKTLESQSWSTVVDSLDLMDGNGLKELVHVLIGLMCHGNQHHGRI